MADDVASEMQMVVLSGPSRPRQLALGPAAEVGAPGTAPNELMSTAGAGETGEPSTVVSCGTPRSRADFNANNVIMWLKQRTGHHSQTPRARERNRTLERQRLGSASGGICYVSSIPDRRSLIGLDLTVRPIGHMYTSGNGSPTAVPIGTGNGGSLPSNRNSQSSLRFMREQKRNETIAEEAVRPVKHVDPTPAVHETLQKQHRLAAHEKRTVSLDRERLATRSVGVGLMGSRLLWAQAQPSVGCLTPQAVAGMDHCSNLSYMPWITALASLRNSSEKGTVAEGRSGRDVVTEAGSTTTATTATAVPHLRPHEVYSLFRAENLPQIRRELQRLTLQQRASRGPTKRTIHVPVRAVRFVGANEVDVGGGLPLADGVSDAGAMVIDRSTYEGSGSRSGNTSALFVSEAASASSRAHTPNSAWNGRKEQLELLVTNSFNGSFVDQDVGPRQNTPRNFSGRLRGSGSILPRSRQPHLRTTGFKRADEGGPIDDFKSDLSISGIRSSRTPRRQSPAVTAMASATASRNGGTSHEVGTAAGFGASNGSQVEVQSVSGGEIPDRHNTSPTGLVSQ